MVKCLYLPNPTHQFLLTCWIWLSVIVDLTLPSVLSLLEQLTTHIRQVLLRLLDVPVGSGQVYTVAQSNLGSLLGSMLNHPHWIGIVVTTGQPGGSGKVYVTTQSNLGLSIPCFLNLHIFHFSILYVNVMSFILGYNNSYRLNVIVVGMCQPCQHIFSCFTPNVITPVCTFATL